MKQFPTGPNWNVAHGRDFRADIVNSKNLNFDMVGFMKLARKTTVLYTEETNSDFGTVQAIVPLSTGTSTTYYVITTEEMFTWDATTTALQEVTAGSSPDFGNDSDGVVYMGILVASGGALVRSFTSNVWTSRFSGRTAANPHPLCTFESRNTLCQADGNIVYQTVTGSWSDDSDNRLTIPAEFKITGMRYREKNLYIATRAIGGSSARLFIWNGKGTAAQASYGCGADWIYSLEEFLSGICVLTSKGQVLRFGGGGFQEIGAFPVYRSPYSWNSSSALDSTTGRCGNRGMISNGKVLYINIDGAINCNIADEPGPFLKEQPSGLWVLDPNVGLYHKAGYAYARYKDVAFSFASGNFILVDDHDLKTGDPVYISNNGGLSGIETSSVYFAIVVDSTTINLALSRSDALAGLALTVTGVESGGTMILDTYTSLGSTYTNQRPGAVGLFITDNPTSVLGSELMFAGDVVNTDGTNSISAFMSLGMGHNRGYFETTPVPATAITDTYERLIQNIHNLYQDADQFVVKMRTRKRCDFPTRFRKVTPEGLAAWTSASTFTIDTQAKQFAGAEEGDEVEIISGAGAGYMAHIQELDDTTSTYTVTLDEAIPGIEVGDLSEVVVDNYKRVPEAFTNESDTVPQNYIAAQFEGEGESAFAQFKVEIRGFEPSVSMLKLINNSGSLT